MKKLPGPFCTTRRTFIKTIGVAGAALMLPGGRRARAQVPGGSLDPTAIPKFQRPLVIPPAMPRAAQLGGPGGAVIDYYEIAMRQFRQQILPLRFPATTVWSYGVPQLPRTFFSPAYNIEATVGRPVRIKWTNDLKDPNTGRYLPHLLPVDQTLHWANPPGPIDEHTMNPTAYTGPVPIVTHLHGGHSDEESDGFPEAWYLPAASNIPAGHSRAGSQYDYFRNLAQAKYGVAWEPGTATFQYENDQRAAALWYHDHALGLVRLTVYSGAAGFYLLRGGLDATAEAALPGGQKAGRQFEVPLAIFDRSFNEDGSLFYPSSREFFDGFAGPYVPDSDIAPIWNAETFGNTMVVNGRTWPVMTVERRRYRFRVLNACNARTLILKLDNDQPIWQIGGDGGFLPAPVSVGEVLLGPAERADLIIDFSGLRAGSRITLLNVGPDEPFGGGEPDEDFDPADPETTGQVMQFRVVGARGADLSTPADQLVLPAPMELGPATNTRQISFNELDSAVLPDVGPSIGLLGLVDLSNPAEPAGVPLRWSHPVTETPANGTTEIWEIYDFTEDAHPFHMHLVQFEVVNREVFDPEAGAVGTIVGPAPSERGRKDTVIVYPGTITRVKAHFDKAGLYVLHCHILEHEDNEMMRPYQIV